MDRLSLTLAASLLLLGSGCPPDDDGSADAVADADADAGPDASALQWYFTCGDPVCQGHRDMPGVAACTDQGAGLACSSAGTSCDPIDDCNRLLLCTDTDPTMQTGGCPISRRAAKRDIEPLDQAQREAIAEALRTMPLATWRYRSDDAARPPRLGFIIEDVAPSPAVDEARGMVDLYGFTAMAVAGLQAQAEQIDALQQHVEALERELSELRDAASPPPQRAPKE
ncbi:MAG: tail fiber domain-containing protein [Deltaproteobacteria bacterium]|nr:tail fiber domain-containing protein [Deltaproteobacteria bacterium]MCB9788668.1 tail fiber domain-containing protein [Deltaproteobacteria bacterium]